MKAQLCRLLGRHIFKYIKSFLDNSSLQGLRYVCDNTLSYWVRFYFAITFVVILSLALNLSLNVYFKWESTPVIIAMSPSVTSIRSVPFPAITICNMNQARYSKVANFQSGTLDYAMLQKICFQELNYTNYEHLKPRSKSDTFENFIIRNAQSCSEMIIMCQFGPSRIPCTDIFREILLDEGMCCVFNLLHPYYLYKDSTTYIRDYTSSAGRHSDIPVDWNPVTGYAENLPVSYYPRRGIGSGVAMGLQIVLNGDIEDYFCSSTNGAGFKLLLYNAIDQPHIKESGLPIMLGYQTNFRIDVRSFEATPNVRNIAREQRQCIFSDEQPLLYFHYYTRRNCEAECDAMYMLRTCGCVPYHLPMMFANVTVCHVRHFACVAEAEVSANDWQSLACKNQCLSSCHDLTFFPTTFATPFAEQNYLMQNVYFNNFTKDFISRNLALVNVYYADNFFRAKVKTPYTGLTEYMFFSFLLGGEAALTGGIMSLMIGFSVISVAEMFHYAFIRPVFDFLQHHCRTHFIG